jgi:hypothetical protein
LCELLLAVWPEPRPSEEVLAWAAGLERFGVGGFGWGLAWRDARTVRHYRNPGRLSDDANGRAELAKVQSTHFMTHLRRPSQLTTIALADTQPFRADDGSFAFEHNGRLEGAEDLRPQFSGRLQGRADSEVGFRLLEQLVQDGSEPAAALRAVHEQLGGTANFGYLPAAGPALAYAGNPANYFFRFRLAGAEVATTALHSADQAVFEFCFPGAAERSQVALGAVEALGESELAPSPGAPGSTAEAS